MIHYNIIYENRKKWKQTRYSSTVNWYINPGNLQCTRNDTVKYYVDVKTNDDAFHVLVKNYLKDICVY